MRAKTEVAPSSKTSLNQPEFSERQQISSANKKFLTTPIQISQRVVAVSDAFGVGVDQEKELSVFKNLDFRYDNGDLIYVTGDSGASSQLFLKSFKSVKSNEGIQSQVLKIFLPPLMKWWLTVSA